MPFPARLIAGRQSLLRAALWLVIFAGIVAGGLAALRWQLEAHIADDQQAELDRIRAVESAATHALQTLSHAKAKPCSEPFIAEMRTVAFLADGLNKFLYAPGGRVHCGADGTRFDPPVELGAPEIPPPETGRPSWRMERDLGSIGHPAVIGTIAQIGDFAVAIPPYSGIAARGSWHSKELFAQGNNRLVWSVAGNKGLRSQIAANGDGDSRSYPVTTTASVACTDVFCVASRADLLALARDWRAMLAIGAVAAAIAAWLIADIIVSWIRRRWSFGERFKRGMNSKSIVLVYQPIVDMRTNEVVSVEVLARWRDLDGAILPPSRFIPLVAQLKRTRQFTQLVIDGAYDELRTLPARKPPLQVNFNVFACDFDSTLILQWLKRFRSDTRMRVAVELVEEQDVDLANAQQAIEVLSDAGVPTYIDDFGTGYSNLARVARLPVEGVKLDRSFAMSPPDSVMGRMLSQVIELIKASGHVIIVEGVETMTRLNLLRSTQSVDLVQGYAIAKPLEIEELRAFLAQGSADATAPPAAASSAPDRRRAEPIAH